MIDDGTRERIAELLSAVQERPTEFPVAELATLTRQPVGVQVDRHGPEAIVVVSPRPDSCFDSLTEREREVAVLVAAGFSNRQITDALYISLGTVKDHVHAILVKTGLESRSQVAAAWYGNATDTVGGTRASPGR